MGFFFDRSEANWDRTLYSHSIEFSSTLASFQFFHFNNSQKNNFPMQKHQKTPTLELFLIISLHKRIFLSICKQIFFIVTHFVQRKTFHVPSHCTFLLYSFFSSFNQKKFFLEGKKFFFLDFYCAFFFGAFANSDFLVEKSHRL